MEKFSQKWCIVTLLENIEGGYEFDKGNWPLHITLAGVHATNWNDNNLVNEFNQLIKNVNSFKVIATEQGSLGPINDPTKVTFIRKDVKLMALHNQIIEFLEHNRASFNNPEWNYGGYIPHSTVQSHSQILENEEAAINNLAIIDMFPNQNASRRKVVKIIKLAKVF